VQLGAARAGFLADSSALMRQRTDFYGCAQRGNGYCKKMRRAFLTDIDTKRAALASITAEISRDRAAALSAALAYRDGRLSDIRTAAASVTTEAKAINRTAGEEKEADAGFKGLVFIILTVAGQTLFYFMVYLQLQVEAGSEIEHELKPNEFWGLPTIIQEFRITAAWRIERGARRLIRWAFGEPDDGQTTAIPYADLYGDYDENDGDDDPVTNGPVIAVNDDDKTGETIVVDSAIKQCRNCGKDFRPKAHNHAYCTTSCKTSYHTNKHNGRAFDAGKYRGRKPSKT
jgi:hypothetical protein